LLFTRVRTPSLFTSIEKLGSLWYALPGETP
jgi:hypothetical protein